MICYGHCVIVRNTFFSNGDKTLDNVADHPYCIWLKRWVFLPFPIRFFTILTNIHPMKLRKIQRC